MIRFPGNKIVLFVFILSGSISACSTNNPVTVSGEESDNEIIIDLNDRKQTIRNFGASDAWTFQFIGLWPDAKRNQVADWLFSMEETNGQPKGIGLTLWRFNIGAGSVSQNNISDEWRSTEGFLQDDMTYDWTRQAGQRWFMKAALERGVDKFVGFSNSPPVQLTKNGKGFSSDGEAANISAENYIPFARFLLNVTKRFQEDEIPFTYLSPFNEPQWDWTGNGQEGSPYTNSEIFTITKILDSLITKESVPVKIQIAEAGKLNYLFEKADKPSRGDQINVFFNDASPFYVGSMPNVDRVISGHSYFTSSPAETLKNTREQIKEHLSTASVPLEFWQSEYCILGNQEEIKPEGKDLGIDPALYVARLIHHDLVIANASAWHWWLALSVYDYKDGLIYADKNRTDGKIEDSKTLWALGNFSRFIRPGSTRVAVHSDNRDVNNVKGTMVSSYVDAETNRVTTVIVNNSFADSSIKLKVSGGTIESWKPYLTGSGEGEELKPLPPVSNDQILTVPKRSVVTLVGDLMK